MNLRHLFLTIITTIMAISAAKAATPKASDHIKVVYTTDVHGNFFPTDFIRRAPAQGSLARAHTAIERMRRETGADNLILLDNGDILQGQPTAYYFNFIDTTSRHIAAEIYDFMGYDAATIGNHDVETGHSVYDRWRRDTKIPILGANVIDTATSRPYLPPYAIIEKGGRRIAVIGLLTPAIPAWLPENLWSGLRFEPMVPAARKWVEYVREHEHPDLVIGLFHSGHDATKMTGSYLENASELVAREVPGFDLILMGHDHREYLDSVTGADGRRVVLLNPANNANRLGVADIIFRESDAPKVTAEILDIRSEEPSAEYMARFEPQIREVEKFVGRRIAVATDSLTTADAFFGPSAFMTLIHDLQLEISGADISLAAPLSFDGVIAEGDLCVADMFTLYKYENMLYTIAMTGREIKDYLEESYSLWTDRISDRQHHLILFESREPSAADNRLRHPAYNFDSAAGIDYTVDITRPKGEKISIISMSDGTPFDPDMTYTVAVNSYRANGGGDLLTKGAGIAPDELKNRVIRATDKDLRYYMMQAIERRGAVTPRVNRNWRFIPEDKATRAAATDRALLFSPHSARSQK